MGPINCAPNPHVVSLGMKINPGDLMKVSRDIAASAKCHNKVCMFTVLIDIQV